MSNNVSWYKQMFSDTAIFSVSIVLSKVISIIMLPLYTRSLSTAEYGVSELMLNITSVAVPLCSLAIPEAIFRFSVDEKYDTENVLKTGLNILPLSFLISIPLLFILNFVNSLHSFKLFFVLITILSIIRLVLGLYNRSINNTKLFSYDIFLYNFCIVFFSVVFIVCFKKGLKGFFWSYVLANLISVCFLTLFSDITNRYNNGLFDKKLLYEMLGYSFPLVLTNISWEIMNAADKTMISNMISETDNGLYSGANRVANFIALIIFVFSNAWSLSGMKYFNKKNSIKFYENIFNSLVFLLSVAILCLLLINSFITPLFLGEKYVRATNYVPLLALGLLFNGLSTYFSPIIGAMKKNSIIMASTTIGCLFNILLNYFLIGIIGTKGACIATAVSLFIVAFIRTLYCWNKLDLKISKTKTILVLIIMIFTTYTYDLISNSKFIVLISLIVIIALYYRWINRSITNLKMIFERE